jgi:hypothetical protein
MIQPFGRDQAGRTAAKQRKSFRIGHLEDHLSRRRPRACVFEEAEELQ